jgi:hypothetical protein
MNKNSFSTLSQKIDWLLKHPDLLLKKYPRKDLIVRAMKHDGLVSRKTYWPDVDVDEAIKHAKLRWWDTHR